MFTIICATRCKKPSNKLESGTGKPRYLGCVITLVQLSKSVYNLAAVIESGLMETDMGNNRSGAWNMGKLARERRNPKSGESRDILTGADWDEGATSKNRSGVSTISESIGGDDITDWARFRVKVPVQVNLITDSAIAAIVNSSQSVVVDSNDGYSSNLTTTLEPGVYFLQFSTESSIPSLFTSQLTLTQVS